MVNKDLKDRIRHQQNLSAEHPSACPAYSLYKEVLNEEIQRLRDSFAACKAAHDANGDDALDTAELKSGAFGNNGTADLSRFLLKNYDSIVRLSGDDLKVGVTDEDLRALGGIAGDGTEEWRRPTTERALGSVALGAFCGTSLGVVTSAAFLSCSRYLSGRYRTGGAIAPVTLGVAGGLLGHADSIQNAEQRFQEKLGLAEDIFRRNPQVLSSQTVYRNLLSSRLNDFVGRFESNLQVLDVDGNGRVDADELQGAIVNKAGDANFNNLLLRHYNHLERLGQTYTDKYEPGVGRHSLDLLFHPDRLAVQRSATQAEVWSQTFKGHLWSGGIGTTAGLGLGLHCVLQRRARLRWPAPV